MFVCSNSSHLKMGLLAKRKVEFGICGDGLDIIKCFTLQIGHIGECRILVGAFDQDPEEVRREVTFMNRKNGLLSEGLLVAKVDIVPFVIERLHQHFQEVGTRLANLIENGNGTHDLIFTTLEGWLNTEEADYIAAVSMVAKFFSRIGATGFGARLRDEPRGPAPPGSAPALRRAGCLV